MKKGVIRFIFLFTILSYLNIFAIVPQDKGYLAYADQMPEPIGGLAEIYKGIEYPETALQNGIEGKVYVLAFINEEGTVDDVKIVKGIGGGCDEAAVKAVKKAKFIPALNEGMSTKIKMALQIKFKLK